MASGDGSATSVVMDCWTPYPWYLTNGESAPLIHAASQQARRAFRDAYRQFVQAFRSASQRFRSVQGLRERFELFPLRSFPPPGPFIVPV